MIRDSKDEDAQILEFARRWLPFGGGEPIDLMVEFGLTPAGYMNRLRAALNGPASSTLDPRLRLALQRYANVEHRAA